MRVKDCVTYEWFRKLNRAYRLVHMTFVEEELFTVLQKLHIIKLSVKFPYPVSLMQFNLEI